jgi:hypothetical protein
MKEPTAEILREYGPFPDAEKVNGVTFDGGTSGLRRETG